MSQRKQQLHTFHRSAPAPRSSLTADDVRIWRDTMSWPVIPDRTLLRTADAASSSSMPAFCHPARDYFVR